MWDSRAPVVGTGQGHAAHADEFPDLVMASQRPWQMDIGSADICGH